MAPRDGTFLTRSVSECTVLVASCDAYSDLWPPYFALLRKHWSDCPFPIALITEEKRPVIEGVYPLCLGTGSDWSSLMLKALEAIETPYILLSLEDFFLRRNVNNHRIISLLESMKRERLNMLRLIPRPAPPVRRTRAEEYGVLPMNAPYRVSTQAALWRVGVLHSLLVAGETAWQFEVHGSERSGKFDGFAAVWRTAFPYRHHAIERGRWFPWAALRFRYRNIGVDLGARPIMSAGETSRWLAMKFTGRAIERLPTSIRLRLKPLARRLGLLT